MYEYANRLSEKGYVVYITYPLITKYMKYRWPYLIRLLISYIEGFHTDEWFSFNKSITRSYVKAVKDKYIRKSDIIITTWWSTASDVGQLSLDKGKKINLIQGYENWEGHEDLLHKSYNMKGVVNVVVASYLKDIVETYTDIPVTFIPNAIDNEKYNISNPIDKRDPYKICMMYSIQEIKGSGYGIEALKKLKNIHPELEVEFFGICPEPDNLPEWIKYYRNPDNLEDLYNRNSIFISNSLTEGMALTPMEAMFCGCACVLTDIKGHSEYAKNNETCILYEVGNIEQLYLTLSGFIQNNQKRIDIAKTGNVFIERFSWDNAVFEMDNLIKRLLKDDN